jgi:hypothetical protein
MWRDAVEDGMAKSTALYSVMTLWQTFRPSLSWLTARSGSFSTGSSGAGNESGSADFD